MANLAIAPCDEGVIKSSPAEAPCSPVVGRWVLVATILGSSMAFIDGSVVNVALAALQRDLDLSVTGIQWVIESYTLFLAALLLVGGSLGDFFGRRRIFVIGVALFTVASVACGLAQDGGQLIAARALQGAGGALLVPGSLAIISASFTEEDRGQAIGTWAGFTAITSALGPVLGGWLIDTLSWRWVFYINIPLAIIVLVVTFWHVPESRNQDAARLDWAGALLAILGLGGLIVGLIESSTAGFTDPLVIISLAIAIIAIPAFLVVEARAEEPMLPLDLFRSRTFSGANLLTLFLYGALGGSLLFFPLNLIQVQGYSATAAGAALLPFILIMFLLSRWSGGLVTRYGPKPPLIIGPIIAAIGLAGFAIPGVGGGYWTTFFLPVALLGFGMAISVAPLTTTVMNSVEDRNSGIASGINNANTRVASLLAIAVLGIVVFSTFSSSFSSNLETIDLPPETRQTLEDRAVNLAALEIPPSVDGETAAQVNGAIDDAFVTSFRIVMLVSAGLALAGGITSAWMIEGPGLRETYASLKADVRRIPEPELQ